MKYTNKLTEKSRINMALSYSPNFCAHSFLYILLFAFYRVKNITKKTIKFYKN